MINFYNDKIKKFIFDKLPFTENRYLILVKDKNHYLFPSNHQQKKFIKYISDEIKLLEFDSCSKKDDTNFNIINESIGNYYININLSLENYIHPYKLKYPHTL